MLLPHLHTVLRGVLDDTFSINVQRYSQNHAQKCIFLRHPMGASEATYALYLNIWTQKDFVAEFHRDNASFTCNQRITISEPPFGGLGVTYAIDL